MYVCMYVSMYVCVYVYIYIYIYTYIHMWLTGAQLLTPFLSAPYAFGVQAAHALWNYGQST